MYVTAFPTLSKLLSQSVYSRYGFERMILTVPCTDVRGAGVWDDYHVVDGRLVTGMNPQSAKSTAKAALEVFEKL
jgi:putative intracellular protease/amidase